MRGRRCRLCQRTRPTSPGSSSTCSKGREGPWPRRGPTWQPSRPPTGWVGTTTPLPDHRPGHPETSGTGARQAPTPGQTPHRRGPGRSPGQRRAAPRETAGVTRDGREVRPGGHGHSPGHARRAFCAAPRQHRWPGETCSCKTTAVGGSRSPGPRRTRPDAARPSTWGRTR